MKQNQPLGIADVLGTWKFKVEAQSSSGETTLNLTWDDSGVVLDAYNGLLGEQGATVVQLKGNELTFQIGRSIYHGEIKGRSISGTIALRNGGPARVEGRLESTNP